MKKPLPPVLIMLGPLKSRSFASFAALREERFCECSFVLRPGTHGWRPNCQNERSDPGPVGGKVKVFNYVPQTSPRSIVLPYYQT